MMCTQLKFKTRWCWYVDVFSLLSSLNHVHPNLVHIFFFFHIKWKEGICLYELRQFSYFISQRNHLQSHFITWNMRCHKAENMFLAHEKLTFRRVLTGQQRYIVIQRVVHSKDKNRADKYEHQWGWSLQILWKASFRLLKDTI